jgi:two-component system OmpR family sensor kinase
MQDRAASWWSSVSLRTKITGVTVLLVTLGLLVAGVGTMSVLRTYLLDETDAKVAQVQKSVEHVTPTGATTCDRAADPENYYFAVLNSDGALLCHNKVATTTAPRLTNLSYPAVVRMEQKAFTVWDSTHDTQWRVIASPRIVDDTGQFLTVVVGQNLDETNSIIGRFLIIFLGFALSVIILGAALTRLLVTSTFAPLREVEATAAAIADGDFSQRLPGATPNTEVGRLNRSLNTMLNRIDTAFADRANTIDQMRRFVGDASHELRTPLVSVRGYAELYRMGALQKPEEVGQAMGRIEKEAIRMGELVADLLELARIDEAKPLQLAAVDLVPIARDAALDAMASQPDRDVTVEVFTASTDDATGELSAHTAPLPAPLPLPNGGMLAQSAATGPIAFAGAQFARLRRRPARPGAVQPGGASIALTPAVVMPAVDTMPAVVYAEENKIRQVVTNLMGNAMRFTSVETPIDIVITVDPERRVATLDVTDHGEGIPPQIREKIFQRFWRADSSRTRETGGSGLGLAIVSGIVASHNGTVDVFETPGGGATFRVTLPLLPEPGAAVLAAQ